MWTFGLLGGNGPKLLEACKETLAGYLNTGSSAKQEPEEPGSKAAGPPGAGGEGSSGSGTPPDTPKTHTRAFDFEVLDVMEEGKAAMSQSSTSAGAETAASAGPGGAFDFDFEALEALEASSAALPLPAESASALALAAAGEAAAAAEAGGGGLGFDFEAMEASATAPTAAEGAGAPTAAGAGEASAAAPAAAEDAGVPAAEAGEAAAREAGGGGLFFDFEAMEAPAAAATPAAAESARTPAPAEAGEAPAREARGGGTLFDFEAMEAPPAAAATPVAVESALAPAPAEAGEALAREASGGGMLFDFEAMEAPAAATPAAAENAHAPAPAEAGEAQARAASGGRQLFNFEAMEAPAAAAPAAAVPAAGSPPAAGEAPAAAAPAAGSPPTAAATPAAPAAPPADADGAPEAGAAAGAGAPAAGEAEASRAPLGVEERVELERKAAARSSEASFDFDELDELERQASEAASKAEARAKEREGPRAARKEEGARAEELPALPAATKPAPALSPQPPPPVPTPASEPVTPPAPLSGAPQEAREPQEAQAPQEPQASRTATAQAAAPVADKALAMEGAPATEATPATEAAPAEESKPGVEAVPSAGGRQGSVEAKVAEGSRDKLEAPAEARPALTPAIAKKRGEAKGARRCLHCGSSSTKGQLGHPSSEYAGQWYCDDCWKAWDEEELTGKCARPTCIYRRHSSQGHTFCCKFCAEGKPHGTACERRVFVREKRKPPRTSETASQAKAKGARTGTEASSTVPPAPPAATEPSPPALASPLPATPVKPASAPAALAASQSAERSSIAPAANEPSAVVADAAATEPAAPKPAPAPLTPTPVTVPKPEARPAEHAVEPPPVAVTMPTVVESAPAAATAPEAQSAELVARPPSVGATVPATVEPTPTPTAAADQAAQSAELVAGSPSVGATVPATVEPTPTPTAAADSEARSAEPVPASAELPPGDGPAAAPAAELQSDKVADEKLVSQLAVPVAAGGGPPPPAPPPEPAAPPPEPTAPPPEPAALAPELVAPAAQALRSPAAAAEMPNGKIQPKAPSVDAAPGVGGKCARAGCMFQRHPALKHGHCCNYCRDGRPHGPACQRKLFQAGTKGAVPVPAVSSSAPAAADRAPAAPRAPAPADASAASTAPGGVERLPVVYWGIVDVKYDPRSPEKRRVSVLELGDGQTSGFSQHGKPIRIRFDNAYCMDSHPLRCALLVENKKVTHDRFVREGFQHLRPPAACYPRRYSPDLARQILADLGLGQSAGPGAAVVLKLCNRSRGAGVVVVPVSKLDYTLKQLLTPPTGVGLQKYFGRDLSEVLRQNFKEVFEESLLHWWSNECPFFVAESCCHSVPISPDRDGNSYDGTMRVSFVLRRKAPYSSNEENPAVDPSKLYEVDWLGGYWKLPRTPLPSSSGVGKKAAEESLEKVLARTVSSFNSADKLTAEVSPSHLKEVCDALSPALPRVFRLSALERSRVTGDYAVKEPVFCAFLLTRMSASVRAARMEAARELLQAARSLLPSQVVPASSGALGDLAARAATSYVERNAAVCHAMQKAWDDALTSAEKSIRSLPTNSTAYYMKGLVLQEREETQEAATCMQKSILFDPDFKLPYIALGTCQLQMNGYGEAAEASRACLRRYPDSPAAHLNRGQALYQTLYGNLGPSGSGNELCKEAIEALKISREKVPDGWQPSHEGMLQYLLSDPDRRRHLPRQPIRTWSVAGWRP